jgi:hypothetical protein
MIAIGPKMFDLLVGRRRIPASQTTHRAQGSGRSGALLAIPGNGMLSLGSASPFSTPVQAPVCICSALFCGVNR